METLAPLTEKLSKLSRDKGFNMDEFLVVSANPPKGSIGKTVEISSSDADNKNFLEALLRQLRFINKYAGHFEEKYSTDTNIYCGMICYP